MELSAADVATLVALVVAGPWGLVIVVALLRGYSISIRIERGSRDQAPPPEGGGAFPRRGESE